MHHPRKLVPAVAHEIIAGSKTGDEYLGIISLSFSVFIPAGPTS
jgi:hypothetical protein